MQTIKLEHDFGTKQTLDVWGGKFLTEDAYNKVVSPVEDVAIYKPGATLVDEGIPLAYVVCNVYPNNKNYIKARDAYRLYLTGYFILFVIYSIYK